MYEEKNIVVLLYDPGCIYPRIITLVQAKEKFGEDFNINLQTDIWSWKGLVDKKIGSGYQYGQPSYQQPIGAVFDITKLGHLNSLSFYAWSARETRYND